MSKPATNWIDLLVALGPVTQTAIWAAVTVFAVYKFRATLQRLADNLTNRIGQGDDVKTPWLSIEQVKRSESIVADVNSAVTRVIADEIAISPKGEEKLSQIRDAIVSNIKKASSLTIDASDDTFGGRVWSIGYEAVGSLTVLLDYIYYDIKGIRPFTYGSSWVLRNERNGKIIEKTPEGDGKERIDSRPLSAVGIEPGDTLKVIRVLNLAAAKVGSTR